MGTNIMAASTMVKGKASGFTGFLMATSNKALTRIVNGMVSINFNLKLPDIQIIQNIKIITEKD